MNTGVSPLAPVVTGLSANNQEEETSVTDLTARIEELVGRFATRRTAELDRPATVSSMPGGSGDAGFAETVARLVSIPLDQYARDGEPLEIRVPWCEETLWFVPIDRDAERLGEDGVSRGRIWTGAELGQLMALPGLTPAVVETLGRVKVAVDGDIAEVRPRILG
jgi:hypothetical protein